MTQSQSQIRLITFSRQLLRLFNQKSNFQTNPSEVFYQQKNDYFITTATNKDQIYKIMSSLNINKSYRPNSIPHKILHPVQDQISKHLPTVRNLFFSTGIFSTILKTAKVIPIHKKNAKIEVSNYRHISILPNIDEIFEKLTLSRLVEFLEERQTLYYKEFGFRKDLTNHVILNLLESIQKALGDGQIACGISKDLEKAFDTVSHDILLEKLDQHSVRGISNEWFRSYLSDRSQYVSINSFNSDYKTIIRCSTGFSSTPLAFLNFHQ